MVSLFCVHCPRRKSSRKTARQPLTYCSSLPTNVHQPQKPPSNEMIASPHHKASPLLRPTTPPSRENNPTTNCYALPRTSSPCSAGCTLRLIKGAFRACPVPAKNNNKKSNKRTRVPASLSTTSNASGSESPMASAHMVHVKHDLGPKTNLQSFKNENMRKQPFRQLDSLKKKKRGRATSSRLFPFEGNPLVFRVKK